MNCPEGPLWASLGFIYYISTASSADNDDDNEIVGLSYAVENNRHYSKHAKMSGGLEALSPPPCTVIVLV